MIDLLDLAVRVEGAEGPDRELDRAIYSAFATLTGSPPYVGHMLFGKPRSSDAPEPYFTASLDAAMGLVPEGWAFDLVQQLPPTRCTARVYGPKGQVTDLHYGITPALALCAAALRARAALYG
jgi:hypothetical protein